MFEEAMMTREETVKECKRLIAAIRKTESEKPKTIYACAACIKSGRVVKAPARKPAPAAN